MTVIGLDVQTLDIWLEQGCDRTIPNTWTAGGVLVDFTGASGRLQIFDACRNVIVTLTSSVSAYGSVYLGTPATSDAGVFNLSFLKALTQLLTAPSRSMYAFDIVWADTTTSPVLIGSIHVAPGSPF
jgi:hypothetical protein